MKEVRVLVVGNGFASRVQLPALRHVGGNRVVGLAGADRTKAAETARAWGIERSGDWRELLTETAPELVLVTTPVHLHHEMASAALDAGAAVLCEKPFALDVPQAEDLAERAAGRPAWLDHELRRSPHLLRLRERLAEGFCGEPWSTSIRMHAPPERHRERPYGWWFDAQRGGGVLGALGSHLIDLVRWLQGEVVAARAELSTFVRERPDPRGEPRRVTADDHAVVGLRLEGGGRVELVASVALPSERFFELQITGSDGSLRFAGDELLAARTGEAFRPLDVPPLPGCAEMGLPEYGIFGRCLPFFLADVLEAVRRGENRFPESPTFADGLATQRVLDAARASSAADGGWVACAPA